MKNMKVRIQQVTTWSLDTEKIIIFTGADQALINSLVRVFREKSHTTDIDTGMLDVEYVLQIDVSLKILNELIEMNQSTKYICTLSEANYKKFLLQKQYTFVNIGDDCSIKIIACDKITNREMFVQKWCSYYKRECAIELVKYIENIDTLRHLWTMQDAGLTNEECMRMMEGHKSEKQNVMEKYSWFLQNLYLKKTSEL